LPSALSQTPSRHVRGEPHPAPLGEPHSPSAAQTSLVHCAPRAHAAPPGSAPFAARGTHAVPLQYAVAAQSASVAHVVPHVPVVALHAPPRHWLGAAHGDPSTAPHSASSAQTPAAH
jgi:hypothetical protein